MIMKEYIPLEKYVCMQCLENPSISWAAMSTYTCGICKKGQSRHCTAIPRHCPECAIDSGLCNRCWLLIEDRKMTQEEIDYQRKKKKKIMDKILKRYNQ